MKKLIYALFILPALAHAQKITTVAGDGLTGYSGDGRAATLAQLNQPNAAVADAKGNLYIADYGNNVIRKVATSGIITTIAGTGTAGYSGNGGAATAAKLRNPNGVILDAIGNLYFCDYSNHCVRKIDTSGIITTIAGTGTSGYNGDSIAASSAELSYPITLAFDHSGNMYIADANNQRIRKVNALGIISTVAGTGTAGFSGDGGPAVSAELNNPYGIALDAAGNIYIGDQSNNRIRKINTSGTITTFAGTGASGYAGDGAAAILAKLNTPTQVWVDTGNNLLIADRFNNCVRKVDASGTIYTIAGTGTAGYTGDGGPATSATLHEVPGVSSDVHGNIYIADFANNCIRKVTSPRLAVQSAPALAANVTLYPNPAHNEIILQTTGSSLKEVVITNLLGQTVRDIKMPLVDNLKINIADLPVGAYLVRINNAYIAKFVKE